MRHIPNILSAFRIMLIPFFIHQGIQGNMIAAAVILMISALTDLLDGFLARRFHWVTHLGKILDPAADKLTQIAICVFLALRFAQYWVFFAVLVLKELTMIILSAYLLKHKVEFSGAKWFGKVATVLFYISMILIVLFPYLPVALIYALLAVTTLFALTAMFLYIPEFIRQKRGIEPAKD